MTLFVCIRPPAGQDWHCSGVIEFALSPFPPSLESNRPQPITASAADSIAVIAGGAVTSSCGVTLSLPLILFFSSTLLDWISPTIGFEVWLFFPFDFSTCVLRFVPLPLRTPGFHHGADRQARVPHRGGKASEGGPRAHPLLEAMGSLRGRETMGDRLVPSMKMAALLAANHCFVPPQFVRIIRKSSHR